MAVFGTSPDRIRWLAATAAVICGYFAPQPGIAHASPTFDEYQYSLCTAAAVLGPDQNIDSVATTCCVDNAGVPTPTKYGVGCVAPVDNPGEDYRPTIVMPTRPSPPGEGDDAVADEVSKLPPPP